MLMHVKNKLIASLSLACLVFGILPQTAFAAADFSASTVYVRNHGPSGSGKSSGNPNKNKTAAENGDQIVFMAIITNGDAAGFTPTISIDVPAGMSYVDNSLEYSNTWGAGWDNYVTGAFGGDDTNFNDPATGIPYTAAISSGSPAGMIRFYLQLDTAGSATYNPVLKVVSDGADYLGNTTVVSPQARLTGGSDGDQKVVVTFGNNVTDDGDTANYLLSVNGGGYTTAPTSVVADSATQSTLTFPASTFSAGNTLSVRITGVSDYDAIQIENTATDGRYETANYTATDTVPASISTAQLISGNTKLKLTFSENMTTGDITTANVATKVTLDNGHNLGGAGLAVNWSDAATLEITLGAGATVATGDTATIPAGQTVRDANGNDASVDVDKVITLVVPVVSAPISAAQTLKSGDVSTSNAQTDTFGKIYMVKNGVAVASKAEIDAAIAAKNAFLAKDGASANTAYTATIPASAAINEGTYDIIAIDAAENLSNRLSGWLTIDNTGPAVALTYSDNPVAPGTLTITATFDAAVTGTPKIAIDQQGTTDIAATDMTDSGDQTVWTYAYTVNADNNGTYDDGVATVTITNATDAVGNANQTASSNTFTIDSTLPGVCGSANGSSYSSAPTTNLCTKGTASAVGVTSSWNWTCTWGVAVSCSASIASSGGGGGGGGGGVSTSTYKMPTSSLKDSAIDLEDRALQMPKSGDYVGIFTRDVNMVHESSSYGDIELYIFQETEITDEDGEPYKGILYAPRFLSTASTPANTSGLAAKGSIWLGRKEGNLSFSKNFKITIPIVEEVRTEASTFAIFYYDEATQAYVNIGGELEDENTGITAEWNKFGKFVIFGSASSSLGSDGDTVVIDSVTGFGDIVGHWGQSYIQKLYKRGVINGKTEEKFDPNTSLTRAELAKIALLNFEQEVGDDESVNFPDADQGAWYMRYINAARRLGVVAGYSDGTFRPNNQVNRAEALKMLISAKGIDPSEYTLDEDDFYDVAPGTWFAPYLAYAYQKGIIEGYTKTIGGGAEGLEVILSDTTGDSVTALQDALFELGFLTTASTGTYDSATKVAVANYQLDRGILDSALDSDAGWFTEATLEQMQTESIGGEERQVRFFYPSNPITRAEAVKIAVALYEL